MSIYNNPVPRIQGAKFATVDRKAFKAWTTNEQLALGGTFKRYATLVEWAELHGKLQAAERESITGDRERAWDMSTDAILGARAAVETRVDGAPQPQPKQPETRQPQPQPETETVHDLFTETKQPAPVPAQVQGDTQAQINNLSATLINLIGSMGQQTQSVDEEQVVALIQKHALATKIQVFEGDTQKREIPETAHQLLGEVVEWLCDGEDVYLVGPAGSGKTTLAEQAAKVLETEFFFTARVVSESKLLGYKDAKGDYQRTAFRDWCERGGVFLFDEIDASCPAALTAFNQALANRHCAFPDQLVKLHKDCKAIAAANTVGTGANRQYVGRNRLDGATLDRFVMLTCEYDANIEKALAGDCQQWFDIVQKYRKAADDLALAHIISPRATKAGAKQYKRHAGDRKQLARIIDQTIIKGLPAEQAEQLHSAAGVL